MHITPNGKRYIGQTCCEPNRRWQNGYGYVNQIFFYAIKKYGWNNIQHIILADNLTSDEADSIEQEYIKKYNTTDNSCGYNLEPGGHGGKHLSNETKQKLSKANSGKNNGRYGYRYSEEERKYMSEHSVWKGRKHTDETRKKISEYAKAHPEKWSRPGASHPMARAVSQFDMDGNFIKEYITAAEAEKETGVLRSNICTCARGRYNSAGGYIWLYSNDVQCKQEKLDKDTVAKRTKRKFNTVSVSHRIKKVNQYDLEGNYIKTFKSVTDAQIICGKPNCSGVSAVCRGKIKAAYGYIWRYADGE